MESTLNLKGKYIMICCVFAPLVWWSSSGDMAHCIALASHELAKRDDFVLVVVPMMRMGFTESRSAYRHFLSGFSCHAVPFHDSLRREYICSALGFDGFTKAVILDPSQKVLFHDTPSMFFQFGGDEHDFFPFTPEREEICLARDDDLDGLSLNELLGLGDSDVLCNMLKDARTTVSELKQKLVGLYMCSDCRSLRTIQEVREECRRQKYELEVVVVCCPPDRAPPRLQQELVMDALASHKMLDVWFFPFNNTVSQRLNRMREIDSFEEGLFIVDSKEQYVDTYGLAIIHDFGIGCYPYTRRTLVEKEFQRLRGLRLSSLLLPWEHVCRKPDDSTSSVDEIPVAQALNNNKIVLLYLYTERYKSLAKKLAEFTWLEKSTRRKPSNVEVVAVSIDGSGASHKDFMEKGLLVCSADPTKSAKLCADFFHPALGPHETLAAFDEDGRITSMKASQFLEKSLGSRHPSFHGDLREEIREEFNEATYLYMLHC